MDHHENPPAQRSDNRFSSCTLARLPSSNTKTRLVYMSCVDDSKKIWMALVVQLYTRGNDYHFICMIFQKTNDLFYYKFHLHCIIFHLTYNQSLSFPRECEATLHS
jgi:hypothetical protein